MARPTSSPAAPSAPDGPLAERIRAALAMAQGNRTMAVRLLRDWARTDDQLLRALTGPFLDAIAANAIDRATRGGWAPAPGGERKQPTLTPKQLDRVLAGIGRPVETGPGGQPLPTKGAPGSARHEKMMRALAEVYRTRRS